MVITVTTANQTLDAILATISKLALAESNRESVYSRIIIRNLGATDIYLEIGEPATIAGGLKIASGGSPLEIRAEKLSKINLISQTSNNSNVRIGAA